MADGMQDGGSEYLGRAKRCRDIAYGDKERTEAERKIKKKAAVEKLHPAGFDDLRTSPNLDFNSQH